MQGSSAISRLPQYLTAQMVRFFYKVDTQQKAKILRKVSALHSSCPKQQQLASLPSDLLSWHMALYRGGLP